MISEAAAAFHVSSPSGHPAPSAPRADIFTVHQHWRDFSRKRRTPLRPAPGDVRQTLIPLTSKSDPNCRLQRWVAGRPDSYSGERLSPPTTENLQCLPVSTEWAIQQCTLLILMRCYPRDPRSHEGVSELVGCDAL